MEQSKIIDTAETYQERSHHILHELAIHLELLDHTSHVLRRWWEVATTTTTSWSNHPANI